VRVSLSEKEIVAVKNHTFGRIARYVSMRNASLAALTAALGLALTTTARAQTTITVNDLGDPSSSSGGCTLRDAINVALGNSPATGDTCASNSGGPYTITITATGTINLSSAAGALPAINGLTLTINGPTTAPGITIDAGGNYRVFEVFQESTFNVNNLTIANGNPGFDEQGGAISSDGTLTVTNCTFSGNSAPSGGGAIATGDTTTSGVVGSATVTNSTFSGNSTAQLGGAIANFGTLTVTNCTFSGNSASSPNAGGIFNGGTLNIKGTILANSTGGNCLNNGTLNDEGYNVADDDSCGFTTSDTNGANGLMLGNDVSGLPAMSTLAANGGPTETFALSSNSPAVGAIPLTLCAFPPGLNPCTNPPAQSTSGGALTCDQRGDTRPGAGGSNCSIGAYEYQATATPTPTGTPTPTATATATPSPTATATPTAVSPSRLLLRPSLGVFVGWVHSRGSRVTFQLDNPGAAAAGITNVQIDATGEFQITSNSCTKTLAAGAHCSITVEFDARYVGLASGELVVTDGAGNSPQQALLVGLGF
jgi:predicted outer membrane repeat protein